METDDRLIFMLSRAQHCLRAYMKRVFENEKLNITPVQSGILFLLRQKSQTMTEISRELSIDNSATTGLVDRLEKAGLAKRKPHPGDRRIFLIEITDKGKEVIGKAHQVVIRVNTEIKEGFSEEEMETFKHVINSFLIKFKKE